MGAMSREAYLRDEGFRGKLAEQSFPGLSRVDLACFIGDSMIASRVEGFQRPRYDQDGDDFLGGELSKLIPRPPTGSGGESLRFDQPAVVEVA